VIAEVAGPPPRWAGFGPPLEILAVWGLAGAQPLLELFGKNAPFFLAASTGPGEIVAFAVVGAFAVPLFLILLEAVVRWVRPSVGSTVHRVLLATLGFAFGLNVARQVGVEILLLAVVIAAGFAALVLWIERRPTPRTAMRYLGAAPLAFLLLFMFSSDAGSLIFSEDADVIDTASGTDGPVAVVVFDELPLASLLTRDGEINEERFPNFARLAGMSTWFRNATSLSHATAVSVPTILTGHDPEEGRLPTSADAPVNIFTLLGGTYDVQALEPATDLCPDVVCTPAPESQGFASFTDDVFGALTDAVVVYGHLTLPRPLRDDLPPVDDAWAGFVESPDGGSAVEPEDLVPSDSLDIDSSEPTGSQEPREHLAEVIADYPARDGTLFVGHDPTMPHRPWRLTPTGSSYDYTLGGIVSGIATWPESPVFVRRALQRHLLQVGWADQVLGRLLDRFDAEGTTNRATIIVTADHGIAFEAGGRSRHPTDTNVHEIYRVPLFVKVPGDGTGDGLVSDSNARTVDIVPTLLDLLGIPPPVDARFDGQALFAPDFDRPPGDRPVFLTPGPTRITGSFEALLPIAERNAVLVGDGDWVDLLQVGAAGRYVTREVLDVPRAPSIHAEWSLDQGLTDIDRDPGERIPLAVSGRIDADEDVELPDQVLVAMDGVVAGVGDLAGSGRFVALLDERRLTAGEHEVQLFLPATGGRIRLVDGD
jgi:hypothetical protein